MIAMNVLTAKAKKTILNVAPSGCGKSVATSSVAIGLGERAQAYDSITLAGLVRLKSQFSFYDGHVVVDDLGMEKSLWSRTSTIAVLANLVYGHAVRKVTHSYEINIEDFRGSVSMNIQPVMLHSLVQSDEWVAVVRDKVIRYYHLIRPARPHRNPPNIEVSWGPALHEVAMPAYKGKLWYELIDVGLTQWSFARVEEHIPDLLRACAALDGRNKVNVTDYKVLIKLLQPLRLERHIVETFGFETGRIFDNNLYCILVELASFGEPTLFQIAVDYKVDISTVRRLVNTVHEWAYVKNDEPARVSPTDKAKELLSICGVNQRW